MSIAKMPSQRFSTLSHGCCRHSRHQRQKRRKLYVTSAAHSPHPELKPSKPKSLEFSPAFKPCLLPSGRALLFLYLQVFEPKRSDKSVLVPSLSQSDAVWRSISCNPETGKYTAQAIASLGGSRRSRPVHLDLNHSNRSRRHDGSKI
jgi:hypothetical protein